MGVTFNSTGWLGYALFAAIGTTLYIYLFLPTAGGIGACIYVTPLFCLSMYLVFHVPLGIIGFIILSHAVGVRNVKVFLLLLLACAFAIFAEVPIVHGQPVPVVLNVGDYLPSTYWVDPPLNVSYAAATVGDEFQVYEFAFFWTYHPVTFPSTCAPPVPTNDWELVYIYVSFTTQQVTGLAYRFHCQWTFRSAADPGGLTTIPAVGVYSPNATRPVITFISKYHVPVNAFPNTPTFRAFLSGCLPDCSGNFVYTQQDYNYTQVSALQPTAFPIDPSFFQGYNWYNIEIFTVAGFVIWGGFVFIFATERRKLAGL